MSFWDYETCEYCGGPILEKRVTLHRKIKDGYVQIENVPAGVCRECGTRFFQPMFSRPSKRVFEAAGKLTERFVCPCIPFLIHNLKARRISLSCGP